MLKKISKFFIVFMACMMVVFTACDSDDDSSDALSNVEKLSDGTFLIRANKDSSSGSTVYNYTYFSLSTGKKVDATSSASTDWDLKFEPTTIILTNSGSTATDAGSSGTGGVEYTGSTDFSAAIDSSSLNFTDDMETDKKVYVVGMKGAETRNTNIMSFPDYDTGDGSQESPYEDRNLNGDQFFHSSGMPPKLSATERVYVVRHADGSGFSKFQVLAIEYSKDSTGKITTYTFKVKYEKL